jgi:hypothetical protein
LQGAYTRGRYTYEGKDETLKHGKSHECSTPEVTLLQSGPCGALLSKSLPIRKTQYCIKSGVCKSEHNALSALAKLRPIKNPIIIFGFLFPAFFTLELRYTIALSEARITPGIEKDLVESGQTNTENLHKYSTSQDYICFTMETSSKVSLDVPWYHFRGGCRPREEVALPLL